MPASRILILTGAHLCRNPRVVKEATTLGEAGYDVTVLGIRAHPPSLALDDALTAGAPYAYRQIELIQGPQAWFRRVHTRMCREFVARCGAQLPGALGPTTALLRKARRHRADLVICHTEAALWAGTQLLNEGRRVAADFEDWHSEDLLPSSRRVRPLPLLRRIERDLLHRASFVTTTSRALVAALHDRYGGTPATVVPNVFPLPELQSRRGDDRAVRFVWFSQTIGPGRGLEEFVTAWSRTKTASEVRLIGDCSASYREHLLAPLSLERRRQVVFTGMVPPAGLASELADCDIGLALEPHSPPNKDLTISNKLLQYLGSGLAVVVSDTAGQREVIQRAPEAGMVVTPADTSRFAVQLDQLASDRNTLASAQRAARVVAETEYCWEKQVPVLLELIQRALATPE